ncbi:hypothetical protein K439DRAFT_1638946 [Ramaria rubella]|nr:hypothetical protein K439DRAFT_1638946 [Ramaria rubella]
MYVSWSELIARVALKTHRSPEDIAFFLNKKYVGYVSNEAEYEKWLETAHDAKTWKPDLYML